MYRLNRQHLLVPALMSAMNVRRELLDRMTTAVGRLEPTPLHVSLFGSLARREGTEHSDIDLLIVTSEDVDESARWHDQMRGLEDQVLAWTGNRLETLVFSANHLGFLADAGESVVEAFRNEALTIYGPEFHTLLEETRGARR